MKCKKLFSEWKLFARQAGESRIGDLILGCLSRDISHTYILWMNKMLLYCVVRIRESEVNAVSVKKVSARRHLNIHSHDSIAIAICLTLCCVWETFHSTLFVHSIDRRHIAMAKPEYGICVVERRKKNWVERFASFVSLWWWVRQRERAHDESTAINNRNEKIIQTNKFRF